MFGLSMLTKGAHLLSQVGKVPFVGKAISAIPVVGTAVTAASLAYDAYSAFKPKSSASPLPQLGAGPMPAIPFQTKIPGSPMDLAPGARTAKPGGGMTPILHAEHGAEIASFGKVRGRRHGIPPAQAFQMLVNSGVTLGADYFRCVYKAPSGYCMVHNPMDRSQVVAVPQDMAIRAGLWKRHAKPPISVRQWHAIKNAKAAIKHLRKVERAAHIVHHATTAHKAPAAAHHKKRK